MDYCENNLTYQDYVSLRNSVGWDNFAEEQVAKSIGNSLYSVTVLEHNNTIAMGRLIGDGIYYLIADVIVKPEFQGMGIGSKIIDMLLKGFKIIPHQFCGSGMRKIIRK